MARTAAELEDIILSATQRDLLQLQAESGLTAEQATEQLTHILACYLIEKKENGSSSVARWLDAPMSEVVAYLDLEDEDGPKEASENS